MAASPCPLKKTVKGLPYEEWTHFKKLFDVGKLATKWVCLGSGCTSSFSTKSSGKTHFYIKHSNEPQPVPQIPWAGKEKGNKVVVVVQEDYAWKSQDWSLLKAALDPVAAVKLVDVQWPGSPQLAIVTMWDEAGVRTLLRAPKGLTVRVAGLNGPRDVLIAILPFSVSMTSGGVQGIPGSTPPRRGPDGNVVNINLNVRF